MAGWRNLKRRLTFRGLSGCCGGAAAAWAIAGPGVIPSDPDEEEEEEEETAGDDDRLRQLIGARPSGMNLAMALAEERNSRGGGGADSKTLMMLIEETDGSDWPTSKRSGEAATDKRKEEGGDWLCCVCMERDKGAAFIPCGHTFCRVCSRDLWAHRGGCPVCNRPILEILDIF
ncbi:unnamed protein product [Linum tenue]|uniref:RING-type domain-containing protein n=1 Tax=Linum tenue TaxID=586396 RepID=A0AAV0NNK3_9ROSI|nr:unnamed protein product [Linum tenue]